MREFKAFYFNGYHLLKTDIITCCNGADADFAKMMAEYIASTHYPSCTHVQVCEVKEKNPQCR